MDQKNRQTNSTACHILSHSQFQYGENYQCNFFFYLGRITANLLFISSTIKQIQQQIQLKSKDKFQLIFSNNLILILLMQSSFNPEQTANDIRTKSFLKSRDPKRETTGSVFFKDNKIRSCSYVKQTQNCLKAVPFYDKRNNTLYPTPSDIKQSWNTSIHSKPQTIYAGMGSTKPLYSYDPKDARNSLGIPNFRPPYPNTSKIEIGSRSQRDSKHYVTNYGNSFINKQINVPTNHPGIEAFRNKWLRSRLSK